MIDFIKEIRQHDAGMGGDKLWMMYRKQFDIQYAVGHNKFSKILHRNDLNIRQKRHKAPKTTDSMHQDDEKAKFCFLHILSETYTHEILSCIVGDSLKAKPKSVKDS